MRTLPGAPSGQPNRTGPATLFGELEVPYDPRGPEDRAFVSDGNSTPKIQNVAVDSSVSHIGNGEDVASLCKPLGTDRSKPVTPALVAVAGMR